MKIFLLFFLLFIFFHAECQKDGFEISTNGLDSIKIGMSKGDVEKVLKTSLQFYDGSTSTIKDQDSAITKWGCNNCTQKYIVRYGTINLLLTFFRFTLYKQTDYELAAISSVPPSTLIHTKAGIKVGISEDKFDEICKNNGYSIQEMGLNVDKTAYIFSDGLDKNSSKGIVVQFQNGRLVDLLVINMIGD
jgi:hypothetical protein